MNLDPWVKPYWAPMIDPKIKFPRLISRDQLKLLEVNYDTRLQKQILMGQLPPPRSLRVKIPLLVSYS